MNVNILVVPALPATLPGPYEAATPQSRAMEELHDALRQKGVEFTDLSDLPPLAEYDMDNSATDRTRMGAVVESYMSGNRKLTRQFAGVVVVNAETEVVKDSAGNPACLVPFAIGRAACAAIQIVRRRGAWAGLTHAFPDIAAFSDAARAQDPSLSMALLRAAEAISLQPVTLDGDYARLSDQLVTLETVR